MSERVYKVGDRVTRKVFMDDGTWARLGDKCLKRSPLRAGTVVHVDHNGLHRVRWDDGRDDGVHYFWHGLDSEKPARTLPAKEAAP